MKARVGSLASRIYAHHEEMGEMRAWRKGTTARQEETEACLESKDPTSVQIESVAVQEEAPKEEAAVETFGALKERHGRPASRRTAQPATDETDPGQWWVPEEVGRRLQRDDPPCHSCTAQGILFPGRRQGQERMDIREEASSETERHQWNKGPRFKEGTTSEEGEDIREELRENHRAGDREANSRVFCQDSKNECQNIVEEGATAQTKEKTANSLRIGDVGALTILGSFACTERKRQMMAVNLDRLVTYEETTRDERP
jgi:hypothetical protein